MLDNAKVLAVANKLKINNYINLTMRTYCRDLTIIVSFLLPFGFISIVSASDDVTITLEQIAQSSPDLQTESDLDWRDINWKDPFNKNSTIHTVGISKTPVASNSLKSDSDMVLELKMPSSTSLTHPDSFDELEDPFASSLNTPDMPDPFEGYNRHMFDFNEGFYEVLMRPIVREYRDSINEDIRIGISNIFDNAMAPLKLASSLLQGDIDKSSRVIGRTLINTTIGLGGIFDVASKFGIDNVNEDIDQVLGSYGIPTGPYIVIPFFGPSYARNIFGRVGGMLLSPTYHFSPGIEIGGALTVTDQVNDTSFIVDDIDQMGESTIDKYESVRDFYSQYRDVLVNE
jgi:phospholipid-binding lipoprotein MlaA